MTTAANDDRTLLERMLLDRPYDEADDELSIPFDALSRFSKRARHPPIAGAGAAALLPSWRPRPFWTIVLFVAGALICAAFLWAAAFMVAAL